MTPYFTLVGNIQTNNPNNPSAINYQNWDLYSFDHRPEAEEIKEVMKRIVASPEFGNYRVIRYIKIEERFSPSEYSQK